MVSTIFHCFIPSHYNRSQRTNTDDDYDCDQDVFKYSFGRKSGDSLDYHGAKVRISFEYCNASIHDGFNIFLKGKLNNWADKIEDDDLCNLYYPQPSMSVAKPSLKIGYDAHPHLISSSSS